MTVNHSIQFKNPETGAHTNNIEGMWRHSKASLSQYCRKKKFYGGYMAKFMFIKCCKVKKLNLLTEFFKMAGQIYDPLLLNVPPDPEYVNSSSDENENDENYL